VWFTKISRCKRSLLFTCEINCLFSLLNLGFTVANICLPSDNLCIAYDDDIHCTLKHRCVCKSSSGYSESCRKNNKSENKQFISHVNNRDLLHLEILVNWACIAHLMWKVNGQQTTDTKWWQKLTLPLARWAKNNWCQCDLNLSPSNFSH
jgi:hypothetical protein